MNDISPGEADRERKYLVTGASGFIGRALCSHLLDSAATVVGTSRRNVDFEHANWTHACVDLTDAGQVDELFAQAKPDYVIHLASCVTGKREIEWVRATFDGNLRSSVNVLVAAQQSGVKKVVLAGSLEEPGAEETHPVAASPYAASKWCSSTYARMMHALYGTRSAVARIFMVYGPGQEDVAKLVPYVCLSAIRSESPKLMSGGRPVDWIYVEDVVEGLVRLAHAGPVDGSHVDLGSGNLVTTGQVAERICELAETGVVPELGAIPDRPMEQVRKADVNGTSAILGWRPETELDTGLTKALQYYREFAAQTKSGQETTG
jgi:nucleoside-diphosphate-sugar epimerase